MVFRTDKAITTVTAGNGCKLTYKRLAESTRGQTGSIFALGSFFLFVFLVLLWLDKSNNKQVCFGSGSYILQRCYNFIVCSALLELSAIVVVVVDSGIHRRTL